jgi:hydrogenase nickel incorporation protein HypA/HybF
MHELSLMSAVIEAISGKASEENFSQVHRVCLEVGQLCNVEIEALVFCFDIVAKGTLAAGASFDIASVPGEGWCERCRAGISLASRSDPCPSCGGWDLDVTGGDRIRIRELEVE